MEDKNLELKDIELNDVCDTKENVVSLETDEVKDEVTNESPVVNDIEKICIICGDRESSGIIIMGKKICLKCEQKAVDAEINSEFYEFYKDRIHKNVVGKLKKLG